MDRRRIGTLAAVASVVGIVLQFGPGLLLDRWVNDAFPGWTPTFGTLGQTFLVYSYFTQIIGVLAVAGLGVVLGYYASKRIDVGGEYRKFGSTVAQGSAVGVALSVVAVLFVGESLAGDGFFATIDGFSLFVLLAAFLRLFVQVSVLITVCALAAVAFTHFETPDGPPRRSTASNGRTQAPDGHETNGSDA